MALEQLDPEITLKLLEGYKDTISQAAQEREQFYQSQSCPHCGGNAFHKEAGSKLFRDGEPLPRYLLRCANCDCVFDPFTGIQLTMGNLAKAYQPAIPILDPSED
jgi:nitrite reductase/ring-hydroxylating ferredoxin subunit